MHNPKHIEAIDGLLDDLTPDQMNRLFHERRMGRKHAAAKLVQPDLSLSISEQHWAALVADFQRPITDAERDEQELDYLIQIAKKCLVSGDKEDAICAAFRVVRWNWAHLGQGIEPIES